MGRYQLGSNCTNQAVQLVSTMTTIRRISTSFRTTISGFETGVLKTCDLTLNNGATFTAGDGGVVSTAGIDVSADGITVDGGTSGTGMSVEGSNSLTLENVDTSGNNGVTVTNSEFMDRWYC